MEKDGGMRENCGTRTRRRGRKVENARMARRRRSRKRKEREEEGEKGRRANKDVARFNANLTASVRVGEGVPVWLWWGWNVQGIHRDLMIFP